jgi:threonine/homoserine/homoserine lactone efflux protein
MDDLLYALIAGAVLGFVVSVPVGPVNLTVINTALRRGFLRAFLAGIGAVCADTLYATAMMAGHTAILDKPAVRQAMQITSIVVITIFGIRQLLFKEEKFEARDEARAEKVDERWHHPRAFLLGFILTISNLSLVIVWATLSSLLFEREWVTPELSSRMMCSAGVFAGGAAWFTLLAFSVSRAHRRVKPRTLTLLVRSCGVVFLIFASLLAANLIWPNMAKTSQPRRIDLPQRAR